MNDKGVFAVRVKGDVSWSTTWFEVRYRVFLAKPVFIEFVDQDLVKAEVDCCGVLV